MANRRGRPAKLPEEKRQQIGMRLSPEFKRKLEEAAALNGRSVAQEAELRLIKAFEMEQMAGDSETLTLLQAIAAEIALIQRETGKRWHKDLATWAAITEALNGGPISRFCPDKPYDDEVVTRAWMERQSVRKQRQALVSALSEHGIYSDIDTPRKWSGIGKYVIQQPKSENERNRSVRFPERSTIQTLDIDDEVKAKLFDLVSDLERLDFEEERQDDTVREALLPYERVIEVGRDLYNDMQKRKAWVEGLI